MRSIFTSILLTVLSYGHVTARELCVSYEVERKPGKALMGHVNTTLVLNQPDCMSACNKLLHCYSVNLYRGTNGDSMCEISTSNREMSPGCFYHKPGYEYNQITRIQTCDGGGCVTAEGKAIGPIAKWKLDGTGKDVRLFGGAMFKAEGARKVLYLDGKVGSYAQAPAVDLSSTSFTIAFWVKSVGPPSEKRILYENWSPERVFVLTYHANRAVHFNLKNENGDNIILQWGGSLKDGTWNHVAVTWDRDVLSNTMFMDGKQHSKASAASGVSHNLKAGNGNVCDVGADGVTKTNNFKGSVKDLMIFDRALTDEEVDVLKDLPLEQAAWKLKLLRNA